MKTWTYDILGGAGVAMVVGGVAAWSAPAAAIVLGVVMLAAAILGAKRWG